MTSLILMLLAFGIIHGAVVQVQPPPRDSIFTEYGKPPVDLQSMVADTDVVVRVQITRGAREEVYRPHPETEYPVTYFDVRILEVFKADTSLEAGDIMSIRRIGGLNDIESGFSRFSPGTQYVFFLRHVPQLGTYTVRWGPSGAFELQADIVKSEGTYGWSRASNGKPSAELLRELRSLKP